MGWSLGLLFIKISLSVQIAIVISPHEKIDILELEIKMPLLINFLSIEFLSKSCSNTSLVKLIH